jgi:hypothetical protein
MLIIGAMVHTCTRRSSPRPAPPKAAGAVLAKEKVPQKNDARDKPAHHEVEECDPDYSVP